MNSFTPAMSMKMFETLKRIAALEDTLANRHLSRRGSYGVFDEPSAVKAARETLILIGFDVQANLKV